MFLLREIGERWFLSWVLSCGDWGDSGINMSLVLEELRIEICVRIKSRSEFGIWLSVGER